MMDTAIMLDFIVKTGIPAGLGVVVVMYLLRVIIPQQQQLFRDTIKSEQETHRTMMKQVTDTLRSEGEQTRASLAKLDNSTHNLTQAVCKLYGHSMTVLENGIADDKNRR